METAHRLPRFFVLWWTVATALGLVLLPLGFGAVTVLRSGWGGNPLLVLAGIAVGSLFSVPVSLGIAQVISLRSMGLPVRIARWVGWTAVGWVVGYLAGGFLGYLLFIGTLVGAVYLLPDLFLVSWFVAVALAGGVGGGLFGLSVATFQAFEFAPAAKSMLSQWRLGGVLGWLPFGAVYGLALSYSLMVGLHEDAVPSWGVALAVLALALGLVSPGLLTGLALKRIVEAQPAPSEDVGATPEVPSEAPPVQ
jgi:hypothetical protein